MSELDPLSQNVEGVRQLVESGTNKVSSGVFGNEEGVESEKIDVLTLNLSDEELLALKDKWEDKYAPYEAKISKIQKANKASYLGKQIEGSPQVSGSLPLAANLQFEAEETFLAAALAKNPEPVVYSDNTEQGNKVSGAVKTMLQFHADQLVIRRKLSVMVRQWSIYHLGVLKHGWNKKINDISIENRKIQDFIFDPDGFVDAYGDFESWLGERITVTAEKLIEMFPKEATYITLKVEERLGTECIYTEWWNDDYSFTTFGDVVLDKHKNELFKYPEPEIDPLTQGPITDMVGEPVMSKPRNHFAYPKKPYTFLSVFSLQEQPHDITGLIEQNIPDQNLITEEVYQIAKNIRRSNNSVAFSENNFTQQTAKQAADAFEKGNPVLVPAGGPIAEAIVRFGAEGFPDAAFKQLENNIINLRSKWGIQGISSQPPNEDTTARGMILNQQHDNTRIGGGIGDAIEQVADNVFNWMVQLYYVYYDEPHFAAIMGQMRAVEYEVITSQDLDRQLIISVSPDSMKPHDELTEINQAVEFFQMGAIGPKTLLTIANFPDPDESAMDGVLWKLDPSAYLQLNWPEMAQKLQAMAQQQMALQQQAQQMEMQQNQQGAEQQMSQKDASHQQKLTHSEQSHQQKLAQQQQKAAQPQNTAVPPAGSSLSSVPIPK